MFHNRMKYFIAAQNYAIRCERSVAIENSKKLVMEMAADCSKIFEQEAKDLRGQYIKVINLQDYYEKTIQKQTKQMAHQEVTISKLSASLFKNHANEEGEKMVWDKVSLAKRFDCYAHESDIEKSYLVEPFDFYGHNSKLS